MVGSLSDLVKIFHQFRILISFVIYTASLVCKISAMVDLRFAIFWPKCLWIPDIVKLGI
jgi:hypothetical protein